MSADITELLRELCLNIGPRPSASESEKRAAEFVAQRLKTLGFETSLEPFRGLKTFSLTYAIIYSLFVVAASLTTFHATSGFLLACFALFCMVNENGGGEIISRFLPKFPSQNVVAIRRAQSGECKRRIILTAHLDSARSGILWHPKLVSGFRRAFLFMLGAMTCVIFCSGIIAWFKSSAPLFAWWLLWICAFYLFGCVLLLAHRELLMAHVSGANDNASGVAAMLGAAEDSPDLINSELWIVATGCEESGLIGIARFLERHQFDAASTFIINLDNCGAGRVTITTREGMLQKVSCDQILVKTAQQVAQQKPELNIAARPFHVMNNDSYIALRRGYRAISIMSFDENNLLPNWHWKSDELDAIEPQTLQDAKELAARLIRALDELD